MRNWKCGSFVCVRAVHSQGYQRLEFVQDEHYFVLVGLGDFASLHRFSPTLLFSVFVLLWFCLRSQSVETLRACNTS